MHTRLAIAVALGLTLCLLGGCTGKKPVPKDKIHYVGVWYGVKGSSLIIKADGTCSYKQKKGSSSSEVNGGGIHWDGKTLICKILGIKSKFSIDQEPTQLNGRWRMKLDGEGYSRR